jgi:hypothetical protein
MSFDQSSSSPDQSETLYFQSGLPAAIAATSPVADASTIIGTVSNAPRSITLAQIRTLALGRTIFVDPTNGNDSNSGAFGAPVASISAAITAARALSPAPSSTYPARIWLYDGTHAQGTYAIENTDNISIVGAGMYTTIITSNVRVDGAGKAIFRPGSNTDNGNFAIQALLSAQGSLQAPIGIGTATGSGIQSLFTNAVVRNVYTTGDSDAVGIFKSGACTLKLFDCRLTSKWDTINAKYSGNVVEVYNSDMTATGPTVAGGGGSTNTTCIVVSQGSGGAIVRAWNCKLTCSGGSAFNNCAYQTNGGTIELFNCKLAASGTSAVDLYSSVRDNGNATLQGSLKAYNCTFSTFFGYIDFGKYRDTETWAYNGDDSAWETLGGNPLDATPANRPTPQYLGEEVIYHGLHYIAQNLTGPVWYKVTMTAS